MFAVNSRLTGQTYSYDGNPHNFGNRHPQYVNYTKSSNESSTLPSTSRVSSTSSSVLQLESTVADAPPPPFHLLSNPKKIPTSISNPPSLPSSSSSMEPYVSKQYFPSPFVFDTQKIIQKVDQALGIPPQSSSGKRGKKSDH